MAPQNSSHLGGELNYPKGFVPPPAVGVGDDPINLASLALGQDFGGVTPVKKLLRTVPRRKPNRQEFFRVHPTHHVHTAVLQLKAEGETYLVLRALWDELPSELTPMALVLAINAQGIPFVWPLRLPPPDGRFDDWGRSAQEAASEARTTWVKMVADRYLGAYQIYAAAGAIPEPQWPEEPFEKIVNLAYRDNFIRDPEHPVLRQLRGAM